MRVDFFLVFTEYYQRVHSGMGHADLTFPPFEVATYFLSFTLSLFAILAIVIDSGFLAAVGRFLAAVVTAQLVIGFEEFGLEGFCLLRSRGCACADLNPPRIALIVGDGGRENNVVSILAKGGKIDGYSGEVT